MLATSILLLALAQETKTTLRFEPKPEESWAYRLEVRTNDEGVAFEATGLMTYHVDDVAKDGSWTNRIVASELFTVSNGREQEVPETEFNAERDAFGVVKTWDDYLPKNSEGFDAQELASGYAPAAPVAKGETWIGRVPKGLKSEPFRFTYVGEDTFASKPYLKLTCSGTAPLCGEVEGTLWLTPDRNRLARLVLRSKKETEGKPKFSLTLDPTN